MVCLSSHCLNCSSCKFVGRHSSRLLLSCNLSNSRSYTKKVNDPGVLKNNKMIFEIIIAILEALTFPKWRHTHNRNNDRRWSAAPRLNRHHVWLCKCQGLPLIRPVDAPPSHTNCPFLHITRALPFLIKFSRSIYSSR